MSTAEAASVQGQRPTRIRIVTAASLFDGHDAAINVMRRLLQAQGAEVIHLGHDRSVDEIVSAAIQEDAHGIAVSSYQGGHIEFFKYMVDCLAERGAGHVRVYGGGGGTITAAEAEALHAHGVARIFGPEEGRTLGLQGMIAGLLADCAEHAFVRAEVDLDSLSPQAPPAVAQLISRFEEDAGDAGADLGLLRQELERRLPETPAPIVGFTGTGGAGKSSVVDELVRRFRREFPEKQVALLLIDPTRRRSGGALLGDRIRMNAIHGDGVFVRSMATRQANLAMSQAVCDAARVLRAAGYDLVLVETAGIGQSDSEIVDLADHSVYVMTPEYGAASQLEKIDMIDLADLVVINKFDRRGALDALRDVRKQWRRNHVEFERKDEDVPVFGTVARSWDDPGLDRLYAALRQEIGWSESGVELEVDLSEPDSTPMIPPSRVRYLAEIAETVRGYRRDTERQAAAAAEADGLARAVRALGGEAPTAPVALAAEAGADPVLQSIRERYEQALQALEPQSREQLVDWPETRARYEADEQEYHVRGSAIRVENKVETLSRLKFPKVAVPRTRDWGDQLRFLRLENVPGRFPFTAGVFPFKRAEEDPARMFAGEGGPERTNRRFHFVAKGQPAARLSTAFDSVTLYGRDPHERPDVYGKVGNSGVSVSSLDDAKKLYSGFDLCAPTTSVSLTINGPAPTVLAFFLNAAIDQQVELHLKERGELEAVRARFADRDLPEYEGELPEGHNGLGLGLLGIPGSEAVDAETYERIRSDALRRVRGTVQADILKEDQAQNTCIFGTDFSLKVMGDIQEFFSANAIKNFYSVSISGYHIAEAGANPITQLAFTLANGLTYCEYYLARGMSVDEFAPNFSYFFSNGLDAEYTVIGRVARRIWAVAMRERYGASERSQKLKYHVQTSGRSLHAQEMAFNDIRTTLQALTALQDHCNSLHTNAYDEAVTTPTEESVRRALAIQLIINREFGLGKSENSLQGSHLIEQLTDQVEEAVLQEFERLSERGGVLGAMETQYQRGKIQDESLHYESLKHSGELPIIGVNTFENPDSENPAGSANELMRSSDVEKQAQLSSVERCYVRWAQQSPESLARLQAVALAGGNVFEELMECVKVASLGQITESLFEAGGRYRRSM